MQAPDRRNTNKNTCQVFVICVWAQWEIIGPGVHQQLGGCVIEIGVCVYVCVRERKRGVADIYLALLL